MESLFYQVLKRSRYKLALRQFIVRLSHLNMFQFLSQRLLLTNRFKNAELRLGNLLDRKSLDCFNLRRRDTDPVSFKLGLPFELQTKVESVYFSV